MTQGALVRVFGYAGRGLLSTSRGLDTHGAHYRPD